jgi:hypothetical protein
MEQMELTQEELDRGRALTSVPADLGEPPARDKPAAINIFDKAILLSVEMHRLGVRKKVKSGAVQTDADPEAIHVSKELLESKAYEDIVSLDGEIRGYVTARCLPGPFRAGVYLLPIASVQEVDRKLEAFKAMRTRMVEKFVAEYPERAAAAQGRLGSLFDPTDYPSTDTVRNAFSMGTQYVAFNTPTKLKEISADIWQREQEKAAQQIGSYVEDMKALLRTQLSELTSKALERLTPTDDGKAKVFGDSLVENIKDFLANFKDKNSVFADGELAAVADKLRKVLDGVNPELLRTDERIREKVRQDFASVQTALDSLTLADRPTRKINFEA